MDVSEALRPPWWLIWMHWVIGRGSHMSPEDAAVIFLCQYRRGIPIENNRNPSLPPALPYMAAQGPFLEYG